jgi:hypothetical protein
MAGREPTGVVVHREIVLHTVSPHEDSLVFSGAVVEHIPSHLFVSIKIHLLAVPPQARHVDEAIAGSA